MLNRLKDYNIICISCVDWGKRKERHQFFMDRFSKIGMKILFIENPGTRPISANKQDFKKAYNRVIKLFKLFRNKFIRKISDNIYVLTPFSIPISNFKLIAKLNSFFYQRLLLSCIRRLEFENIILWSYLPIQTVHDILDHIDYKLLIYDCVFNLAALPHSFKNIELLDNRLRRKSDIVFVDAFHLLKKEQNLNDNTIQIPAGIDYNYYNKHVDDQIIPDDIADLTQPIIGYVGSLHQSLDLSLIRSISKSYPQYSIVLVGPKLVDIREILNLENIHILGEKDHSKLPSYINTFSVCIIPYYIDKFTKTVFPTKIFEYLALGKPVISTALPEIQKFQDFDNIVEIAIDADEFIEKIKLYIDNDSIELKMKRMEIAKNNTWDMRFSTIVDAINKALN